MLRFLLTRFLSLVVVLFFVVSVSFMLLRSAQGDPFIGEKDMTEEVRAAKLKEAKLDGSLFSQLGRYWTDLIFRGDMRASFKYKNRTVKEILGQSLPVSFMLGGAAFVIATIFGVLLGTYAAMRRNTWGDFASMFGALLAISTPSFITGPLLVMVFALWLGWLPVGGWFRPTSIVLPAICLAAPYVAYIARLMRNSMIEVLHQDFVRTAKSKGLAESKVVFKHALKVAILPVVTFMGPLAAHLLTGSIVVESIFSIPGAGQYFVNSILNRDYMLLLGVVIIYCTLLVAFNFIVDIAYCFLDKRIKLYA